MRRWLLLLVLGSAFGIAAFAVGIAAVLRQPTYPVAVGEAVRQDDFRYTVVDVMKARVLGTRGHRIVARGVFYVVTVQIDNDAKRVAFRWDPSMAFVTDAAGRRYDFSIAAQRLLDSAEGAPSIITAGSSARVRVAFDVPPAVEHAALGYSNGILMGDLFDAGAYTRARIPLD